MEVELYHPSLCPLRPLAVLSFHNDQKVTPIEQISCLDAMRFALCGSTRSIFMTKSEEIIKDVGKKILNVNETVS